MQRSLLWAINLLQRLISTPPDSIGMRSTLAKMIMITHHSNHENQSV